MDLHIGMKPMLISKLLIAIWIVSVLPAKSDSITITSLSQLELFMEILLNPSATEVHIQVKGGGYFRDAQIISDTINKLGLTAVCKDECMSASAFAVICSNNWRNDGILLLHNAYNEETRKTPSEAIKWVKYTCSSVDLDNTAIRRFWKVRGNDLAIGTFWNWRKS